ncbi:MAG: hypothetical protein IKR76_03440 [Ruminococcus sp.]|nr:hypothetical protein [Ruminococcus sp.]
MNNSFKKVCAATAAMAMALSCAMSVYAEAPAWRFTSFTDEEKAAADNAPANKVNVHKPYLNVTVDGGELDLSETQFQLKCGDTVVGTFSGKADSFTLTNSSVGGKTIYDITGAKDDKEAGFWSYSMTDSDRSDPIDLVSGSQATFLVADDFYTDGDNFYEEDANNEIIYYLNPNGSGYAGYFDVEKYEIVDSMTVPAGQYIVDVSDDYIDFMNNGASDSTVSIETTQSDWDDTSYTKDSFHFSEVPGTSLRSVPTGDYRIMFHGGNLFNRDLIVTDYDREFIKIRVPVTDFPKIVNVNGTYCIKGVYDDDSDFYYPVAGFDTDPETGYKRYVLFPFYTGGAVTADILSFDADGGTPYYDIWVDKSNPYVKFQTSYAPGGGGQVNQYADLTAHLEKIVSEMAYPESGVTLYNVPAGEYSVEIVSDDKDIYEISDNTLTVTETKDLQTIPVKVKKIEAEPIYVYGLGVTAKASVEECYVGDTFEVTITATNTGDTDLTNLSVLFEDTEVGTAETLKVGESIDFTIKLKAQEEDIDNGNITSTLKQMSLQILLPPTFMSR